ncbi:MarR family transcriptional regulator [Streptococcus agalactiae LMG 14747]|uniref:MarR family transcriptional regulator n=1 Tax=Streptococcus agalactiae LMG 14747 TaxID=1154860 RepID=V6Z2H6_STRAG|nr:MarR family transcriptional regulator [Streptococcus agalactiae LMG 14747]
MREKNTVYLLKRADLAFEKIANRMLSPYKITHTQFKFLRYLSKFPDGQLRQHDVELYFDMTNPTVTRVLQNLEKDGWVYRQSDTKDRRSKHLYLTDFAKERIPELAELGVALEQQLTQRLNNEELDLLQDLLRKMLSISIDEGKV